MRGFLLFMFYALLLYFAGSILLVLLSANAQESYENTEQCPDALESATECIKPDAPCATLPDACFNGVGTRGCEINKTNAPNAFECIRGMETWHVCAKSAGSVQCQSDSVLGTDSNMRYKNVTFECELCFMSPSTELEVIATPKNGVTQRCRTENANPALSVPHSKEVMAVKETHFCLGSRQFHRFEPCNYHSQKKWSQACLLSIFVGGFGGDRFYLEYWGSGLGKLLTVGGLGIWTVIDIFLVCSGYIGPEDGSLYMW